MKHYCPECKKIADYKDEENYSNGIICDLCKEILLDQWAKEDSGDGSYVVFSSTLEGAIKNQIPRISVIIPSRQGIPQVLKDSISFQSVKPDEIIEVIGSALTVQRNEGVKVVKGDILVFIDDDMILRPDFIYEITRPFVNNFIKAVSGNPQVRIYKTNFFYELYARLFMLIYRGYGIYQKSGFPTNYHKRIEHPIYSKMLHGCCMAVHREIFEEYKFNENLVSRMYGEDDYFANEIVKDYDILYNPNAICYDTRPYPKGKQTIKIRSTIYNLIIRHRRIKRTLLERICFIWAMFGFINFKIIEAIVMRDISIIKGLLLCFIPYTDRPIEDIRKEIIINKYNNDWKRINV